MGREAIGRDIMVNAIYCGNPADEIAPGWREVATLADGKFASIDQNNGTIIIASPFDDELAELSAAVSKTYIPFTATGWTAQEVQVAQDANAENLNAEACSARAMMASMVPRYFCQAIRGFPSMRLDSTA